MNEVRRISLLGRLASSGWFMRRAEVTSTTSMTMLLRDEPFRTSFLSNLSERTGVRLDAVNWFDSEIIHLDGGRVDIEGSDDEGNPLVMIEAKINHHITRGQIDAYIEDQTRRLAAGVSGVFVLLVPEHRRREAELALQSHRAELSAAPSKTRIESLVLTWHDTINLWEEVLSAHDASAALDSPHVDLHQFAELCRAFGGLRVSVHEASEKNIRRDIWLPIVDAVTREVSFREVMPIVSRTGYAPSRYITTPIWDLFGAVGVQNAFADEGLTPLWVRFNRATGKSVGGIERIRSILLQSSYAPSLRFEDKHVWLPLEIDETLPESELVTSLSDQYRSISAIVFDGLGSSGDLRQSSAD